MYSLILIYLLIKDRLKIKEQYNFDNLKETPNKFFLNNLETKRFINEIFLILASVSFIIEFIKIIS